MEYYYYIVIAVGILLKLILGKLFFNGPMNKHHPNLNNKIAIVTGGNSGIGFITAREFAKLGATVIIGCRDENRGIDAEEKIRNYSSNRNVFYYNLDLSSFDSIRQFVNRFKEYHDKLDILVNNAGIMALPKRKTTENGLEMQVGVNHFGHFLLTNLLIEQLKVICILKEKNKLFLYLIN